MNSPSGHNIFYTVERKLIYIMVPIMLLNKESLSAIVVFIVVVNNSTNTPIFVPKLLNNRCDPYFYFLKRNQKDFLFSLSFQIKNVLFPKICR